MSKILAILSLTVVLLVGHVSSKAEAQPIGPYCFSIAPFANQFVFFFNFNGGNQYSGTGRDFLSNTPMTATLFVTGDIVALGFTVMTPPTGTGHLFSGSAHLNAFTGIGPGRCETLNASGGCGTGTAITMALIACQPGATS